MAKSLVGKDGASSIRIEGVEALAQEFRLKITRVRQVAQSSLNRMAESTRTQTARAVRDEVRQSYAYARNLVLVKQAYFEGGRYQAEVTANRRGLLLSRYQYRQNKQGGRNRGVFVTVGRTSTAKLMPGAFVIRLPGSGTAAIAVPRDSGDKAHGRKLNVLHGPSASQIFDSYRIRLARDASTKLHADVRRRLQLEIVKAA